MRVFRRANIFVIGLANSPLENKTLLYPKRERAVETKEREGTIHINQTTISFSNPNHRQEPARISPPLCFERWVGINV